jgi:hypothetical protein
MIIRNQDKLRLPDDLFYKMAGKVPGPDWIKDVEEVQSLLINSFSNSISNWSLSA